MRAVPSQIPRLGVSHRLTGYLHTDARFLAGVYLAQVEAAVIPEIATAQTTHQPKTTAMQVPRFTRVTQE